MFTLIIAMQTGYSVSTFSADNKVTAQKAFMAMINNPELMGAFLYSSTGFLMLHHTND